MTLMARRRSRVPAECGERPCASGTRAGTQRNDSRIAIWLPAAVRRVAPGSRVSLCSPGHERGAREVAAREANRWPSFPIHDVKQRSVVRSRGALVRPGCPSLRMCLRFRVRRPAHEGFGASGRRDSSDSVPPMRGDGAPTGALILSVAPAQRDHPVPGRPGPLSALHRGDFRMRTHEAGSRQWNRSRSDCPRQTVTAWRSGSGPPCVAVRAASAGRHSWLRFSGSFLENAPLSQDVNPVPQTRSVVNSKVET